MIKITVTVSMLLFVCSPCSQSNTKENSQSLMPSINDSYQGDLDDLRFVELQISAVMIDVQKYLGWFFSEKEMMKRASARAISDLGTIKDYLQKISFTDDLVGLRDINLTIIDMLSQTYDNIDTKQEEEIRQDFAECSEIYCQYIKKFEEYSQKQIPVEDLPEDLSLIHNTDPNAVGGMFDIEKEIHLLSEILDANEYSPLLLVTWYKWRAQKQLFFWGLSNRSNIPNWLYNKKRWKVVQTIKKHIETDPDDTWAKAQKKLLLDLPNVGRGGHFGNDALGMRKVYLEID